METTIERLLYLVLKKAKVRFVCRFSRRQRAEIVICGLKNWPFLYGCMFKGKEKFNVVRIQLTDLSAIRTPIKCQNKKLRKKHQLSERTLHGVGFFMQVYPGFYNCSDTVAKILSIPGTNPIKIFTPKDKFTRVSKSMKIMHYHQLLLVVKLGHNTLTYMQDYIFLNHSTSNLGSLFYTAIRCKKFYRIGPQKVA